jgi:hypothetical protein
LPSRSSREAPPPRRERERERVEEEERKREKKDEKRDVGSVWIPGQGVVAV